MTRFELVTRNTEEIITAEELSTLLQKKHPRAYIGYATTGQMHIGHLMPIVKIMDFLDADLDFTFLIADLHGFLDDQKTPWELLDARSEYYEKTVKAMLESIGANTKRVTFAKGSDFELEKDYVSSVFHLAGETTLARTKRAASEVVRFSDTPKLSGFLYPLLQTMDVPALNADIAFGGIDQRGIYMLSREILPLIGKEKPMCIFTPLLPSMSGDKMGGKMSASDSKSKLGITESTESVEKKIMASFCPANQVKDNWVMLFYKNVIFPVNEKKKKPLVIKRPEKFGGDLEYSAYDALEKDFASGALHPMDAKKTLANEINSILEPVRKKKDESLIKKAYPE
ncbi:tyrosine--tRNA ligase [archaeon]|nr:tyrosine--tRNA ligase [archaeon]